MSKDPDNLRQNSPAAGGDRPQTEDPLVELARIVHKNKQTGVDLSKGRVGSTDYFAGLDDVVRAAPEPPGPAATQRAEPFFGAAGYPPVDAQPVTPDASALGVDRHEPVPAVETATPDDHASPPAPGDTIPWPSTPSLDDIEARATETMRRSAARVFRGAPGLAESGQTGFGTPDTADRSFGAPVQFGAPAGTQAPGAPNLDNAIAVDLEQNLTAELEDELIGALRQSIDPVPGSTAGQGASNAASGQPTTGDPAPAPFDTAPAFAAQAPVVSAQTPSDLAPARDTDFNRPRDDSDPLDVLARMARPEPEAPAALAGQSPSARDEDLFLEDTAAPPPSAPATRPKHAPETRKSGAEFDVLFADLDLPDPAKTAAAVTEDGPADKAPGAPASEIGRPSGTKSDANDIDDMTWPAAAAAVPKLDEDDTPPPPGGYDLDAVAKAMHESDPSLKGSGVLPPHPKEERVAAPTGDKRSRKGLFAAAAVVGIAVVGAGAFALIDSDAVDVPSGPPPIIAGIQEPLKVFPDASAGDDDRQGAKLIYDRVGAVDANARERLVLPETPEPADLPPAPDASAGTDSLVPGTPKRVRTLVVRPDGTIISDGTGSNAPPARTVNTIPITPGSGQPAAAEQQTATDSQPAPVQTAAPGATPSVEPAPVTPAPVPAETVPAGTETAAQVPAPTEAAAEVPETPATPAETAQQATPPAVPAVLPRRKPEAPVQVARAPAATAPVAAAPASSRSSGPLDLSNPGPAPAQPAATTPETSISAGSFIVQVTSQRSETAARNAYTGLQQRYPSVLGSRSAVIVRADLGDRGTFYRARIPTGSRAEAITLCENLKAAGGDCFVRRN